MRTQMDWLANLATGRARCLHRYFKGEDYARSMDVLDGVEHQPVCDGRQALLHARALRDLAEQMVAHLEGVEVASR